MSLLQLRQHSKQFYPAVTQDSFLLPIPANLPPYRFKVHKFHTVDVNYKSQPSFTKEHISSCKNTLSSKMVFYCAPTAFLVIITKTRSVLQFQQTQELDHILRTMTRVRGNNVRSLFVLFLYHAEPWRNREAISCTIETSGLLLS